MPINLPVVDALSRIPATREREGEFVMVKAIPGTSESIVYVCLGDNANPTVYTWQRVT